MTKKLIKIRALVKTGSEPDNEAKEYSNVEEVIKDNFSKVMGCILGGVNLSKMNILHSAFDDILDPTHRRFFNYDCLNKEDACVCATSEGGLLFFFDISKVKDCEFKLD